MAITGPASFIPTINEFLAHWAQCNTALPPATPLVVPLPGNVTVARTQLLNLRDALQAQQAVVQAKLTAQGLVRGTIELQKAALLESFNQFTAKLDGYYRNTNFYRMRPHAPGIGFGQHAFSDPMGDALGLWESINAGPAPAGVTLPLVLTGGLTQGVFSSAVSALQFSYADEKTKTRAVILERGNRDQIQDEAYEIMKLYRECLPSSAVAAFPVLVDTVPRLSPAPGHTPNAVNASAIFEAPDSSKIVYDASTDSMLASYQLRGNVGEDYSDEDAVVIATNLPGAPREFVTPFGLNQPGATVALKVYVILTTGNEAGSAAMFVQRPANVELLAA